MEDGASGGGAATGGAGGGGGGGVGGGRRESAGEGSGSGGKGPDSDAAEDEAGDAGVTDETQYEEAFAKMKKARYVDKNPTHMSNIIRRSRKISLFSLYTMIFGPRKMSTHHAWPTQQLLPECLSLLGKQI